MLGFNAAVAVKGRQKVAMAEKGGRQKVVKFNPQNVNRILFCLKDGWLPQRAAPQYSEHDLRI